jgi:hypothetical protein
MKNPKMFAGRWCLLSLPYGTLEIGKSHCRGHLLCRGAQVRGKTEKGSPIGRKPIFLKRENCQKTLIKRKNPAVDPSSDDPDEKTLIKRNYSLECLLNYAP